MWLGPNYKVVRDNWSTLLHLTYDICQRAQLNSYDLVEKWVQADVGTFISGLKEIIARNDFMKSLQQCYAQIAKSGIL